MFVSRNKSDLIIEVWEKLDCESVGAEEILAIETVVRDRFGDAAVDSPMVTARLLADEGAELRHPEIMELYIQRAEQRPFDAALRNLIDARSFESLHASITRAENLRRKYAVDKNRPGLRLLREEVIAAKEELASRADQDARAGEAAEWLRIWLQSPELFEQWVKLRRSSASFAAKFGPEKKQ